MAGTGQFKRAIASRWTSVNPILNAGELGLETDTRKMKFGDGTNHWNDLLYANIGNTGPQGVKGDTGTGLSRQLSTTIDFLSEENYVEKVISDVAILSTSVIIVQALGEEFAIQGVNCGVVSITQGVGYTIFAAAPDGASGEMSINILIF